MLRNSKKTIIMHVIVIPLEIHYSHILTSLNSIERLDEYIEVLQELQCSLTSLLFLFNYNNVNHIRNSDFYRELRREISKIDCMISEATEKKDQIANLGKKVKSITRDLKTDQ